MCPFVLMLPLGGQTTIGSGGGHSFFDACERCGDDDENRGSRRDEFCVQQGDAVIDFGSDGFDFAALTACSAATNRKIDYVSGSSHALAAESFLRVGHYRPAPVRGEQRQGSNLEGWLAPLLAIPLLF